MLERITKIAVLCASIGVIVITIEISIRFVAVFPGDVKEAEQYLKDKGIGIQDVVQAMPNSVGASGFPTLMLLDKTGTVKKAWTGKLSAERESPLRYSYAYYLLSVFYR